MWIYPFMGLVVVVALVAVFAFLSVTLSSQEVEGYDHSPFECGVMPYSTSYSPFYVQFYCMSVIFLVFDVEIVILLPMVEASLPEVSGVVFWLLTFLLLFMGLLIEIGYGSLEWKL
uniref:NADH-ubiquinone oxidoreductase chain 3 n=1 Tax=Pthirus pubis TaxID=121228 RepID=C0ILV4_PTHPU|nr:NADH dehydrogenase subunit 3 [Pthirus pubis]